MRNTLLYMRSSPNWNSPFANGVYNASAVQYFPLGLAGPLFMQRLLSSFEGHLPNN